MNFIKTCSQYSPNLKFEGHLSRLSFLTLILRTPNSINRNNFGEKQIHSVEIYQHPFVFWRIWINCYSDYYYYLIIEDWDTYEAPRTNFSRDERDEWAVSSFGTPISVTRLRHTRASYLHQADTHDWVTYSNYRSVLNVKPNANV